jgi:hypothetical protein
VDFFDPEVTFIDADDAGGYLLRDSSSTKISHVPGVTNKLARFYFSAKTPKGIAIVTQAERMNEGTIIHSQLQSFFQSGIRPSHSKAISILNSIETQFPRGRFSFSSEVRVSDFSQYASAIDLVAIDRNTNHAYLIDFKTGGSTSKPSQEYAAAQLSIYKRWYKGHEVDGMFVATPKGIQPVGPVHDNILNNILYGTVTHQYDFHDDLPKIGVVPHTYKLPSPTDLLKSGKNKEREFVIFDTETSRNQIVAVVARKVKYRPGQSQPILVGTYVRYYEYKGQRDPITEEIHHLTPEILAYLNTHGKTRAKSRYYDTGELEAFKKWVGNAGLITANGIDYDIPLALMGKPPMPGKHKNVRFQKESELDRMASELLRQADAAVKIEKQKKRPFQNVFDLTVEMQRVFGMDIKGMNTVEAIYKRVFGKSMLQDGLTPHNAEHDTDAVARIFFALTQSQGAGGTATQRYFQERTTRFLEGKTVTMPYQDVSPWHPDQKDLTPASRMFLREMQRLSRDQRAAVGEGLAFVDYDDKGKPRLRDISHWAQSMYVRGVGDEGKVASSNALAESFAHGINEIRGLADATSRLVELMTDAKTRAGPGKRELHAAFGGDLAAGLSFDQAINQGHAGLVAGRMNLGGISARSYFTTKVLDDSLRLRSMFRPRIQSGSLDRFDEMLGAFSRGDMSHPAARDFAVAMNSGAGRDSLSAMMREQYGSFRTASQIAHKMPYAKMAAARRALRFGTEGLSEGSFGALSSALEWADRDSSLLSSARVEQALAEASSRDAGFREMRHAGKVSASNERLLRRAEEMKLTDSKASQEYLAGWGGLPDFQRALDEATGTLDQHRRAVEDDMAATEKKTKEAEQKQGKWISATPQILSHVGSIAGSFGRINFGANIASATEAAWGRVGAGAADMLGPFAQPFTRYTTAQGEIGQSAYWNGPAQTEARVQGHTGFWANVLKMMGAGAGIGTMFAPGIGTLIGGGAGALGGALEGIPDLYNIGPNVKAAQIQGHGTEISSRLNMWSAVFDVGKTWLNSSLKLAMIPINFFANALGKLGQLLRGVPGVVAGGIGYMSGLTSQIGHPALTLMGNSMRDVQASYYTDIAMRQSKGTTAEAAADMRKNLLTLYSAGNVDENRIKYSAIGGFLQATLGDTSKDALTAYYELAEMAKGFNANQMALLYEAGFGRVGELSEFMKRHGLTAKDLKGGNTSYNGTEVYPLESVEEAEAAMARLNTIMDNFRNVTLTGLSSALGETFFGFLEDLQRRYKAITGADSFSKMYENLKTELGKLTENIEWKEIGKKVVSGVLDMQNVVIKTLQPLIPTAVNTVDNISAIISGAFNEMSANVLGLLGPAIAQLFGRSFAAEFDVSKLVNGKIGLALNSRNDYDAGTWDEKDRAKAIERAKKLFKSPLLREQLSNWGGVTLSLGTVLSPEEEEQVGNMILAGVGTTDKTPKSLGEMIFANRGNAVLMKALKKYGIGAVAKSKLFNPSDVTISDAQLLDMWLLDRYHQDNMDLGPLAGFWARAFEYDNKTHQYVIKKGTSMSESAAGFLGRTPDEVKGVVNQTLQTFTNAMQEVNVEVKAGIKLAIDIINTGELVKFIDNHITSFLEKVDASGSAKPVRAEPQ